MAFTGTLVEWFAVVLAVIVLAKFLMYLFAKNKTMSDIAMGMIGNQVFRAVELIAAVVLGWYVVGAIGIVNFAAAFLAVAAYYGYVLLSFPKEMKSVAKTMVKKRTTAWPAWIYAIVLALWTLWALFY